MSFSHKVVVITGAGSGMGEAIALHFAKLNSSLCLIDINGKNVEKVSEDCEKLSQATVLRIVADLAKDEEVKRSIELVLKERGTIDVLVNCAGIHSSGNIKEVDILEKYDAVMAVNLRAAIALTNLATPALIRSKGSVINISSVSTKLISDNSLPYTLSKAGINHFTKCAALELASEGVRVNCISPGPVSTNLLIHAGMDSADHEKFWTAAGQLTALKKLVNVEEIAELAVFLASDKAHSITGSNFVVDCGMSLRSIDSVVRMSQKISESIASN